MKLSRAALRPLLAAHERGALPLGRAAWGVTARKASHNASNARGVAAGKMGHYSSIKVHTQLTKSLVCVFALVFDSVMTDYTNMSCTV